jgi:hypothetical protein
MASSLTGMLIHPFSLVTAFVECIQGVSGGIVNIFGGGSMGSSE